MSNKKEYFYRICEGHARLVAEAPDAERADTLEHALKDAMEGIGGKTGSKEVIIVDVLEEHRQLALCRTIPRMFEVHEQFRNAYAASHALGLKGNQVSNALSRAKRDGESRAEIRGVVVMYMDDFVND